MPHATGSAAIVERIASELKISERTVLRILSRPTIDPRPTIRARAERVRALAGELGYRANTAARAARTGRLPLVALVQRAETDFMPFQLTRGLTEALMASDRELLVTRVPGAVVSDPSLVPRTLREVMASGLVIHQSWDISDAVRGAVAELGLPAVWVNTRGGGDCVWPDEADGIAKLTRELQRLGHKRIAFVNNHLRWDSVVEDHYSSGERRRGYVEAMAAAGRRPRLVEQIYLAAPVLDASDSLIRHHGLMPPWGGPGDDRVARAIALLRSDDRPTAVVCPNADSAGPMLVAAGILGLSVPGELSVCCVEFDIPCVHGHRTTTGIIPFYECGLAAIARLDERMAGKRPSRGVAVPYVRFEGTTIGPLSTS